MAEKTIVCFASGYDAPPTSKHHAMHHIAETDVVLWVNYHASRTPSASASDAAYIVRKLAQVASGLQHPRKNLYVLTPLVLPLPGSRLAKKINRALLATQIRMALGNIGRGPVEFWSFAPDVAHVVDTLNPRRVMYYCVDDFAHFTGYDAEQVLADEAEMAHRADLVVTTSMTLQESKHHLNPNTLLVPHGVEFAHFYQAVAPGPEPDDLKVIPHPRLGFFGLIRDWVDLAMLADIARRRPEWQVVMLGDWAVDISPYRALPNLHFLGRKRYDDLPDYCRGFDVGLIPFVVNELTEAVNPIKLREYLAAGLPVVSSPMPEVRLYKQWVEIAEGADAFEQAIERCLQDTPQRRQERIDAMREETWPRKIETIRHCLETRSVGETR